MAQAQNVNTKSQVSNAIRGEFRQLALSIAPSRTAFLPLEPIPVRLTLENKTDLPIMAHAGFDFGTSYVKVQVQVPIGTILEIKDLSLLNKRMMLKNSELPPNAKFESTQLINYDLQRYFVEPGQYKIKATFLSLDGSQTVSSEWKNFTITQPAGVDLAAYDFLKRQKHISIFFSSFDEESVQEQRTFVDIFPESDYTNYVRYLLVDHYLLEGQNDKAKQELEKIIAIKDFVFGAEANKKLTAVKNLMKKTQY